MATTEHVPLILIRGFGGLTVEDERQVAEIYEGWFDTARITLHGRERATASEQRDLVLRLDFYVGERDSFGIGFSDNVIFRKQYYLRALAEGPESLAASFETLRMYLYEDESFADDAPQKP